MFESLGFRVYGLESLLVQRAEGAFASSFYLRVSVAWFIFMLMMICLQILTDGACAKSPTLLSFLGIESGDKKSLCETLKRQAVE